MKKFSIGAAAIVLAVTSASVLAANPVTYTVQSAQSSLTASGSYLGDPIVIQSAGSLTTSYFGTINADRDIGFDTLDITGGTVTANNSGSYIPAAPPPFAPTTTPPLPDLANYGTLTTSSGNGNQYFGAVRSFAFDPASGLITGASSFNAALFSALISGGSLDYVVKNGVVYGGGGSTPVGGNIVLTSGTGTVVDDFGLGIETLTVPIDTDLSAILINGQPVNMHLSGQIVATRELDTGELPEPASLSLLGLGAAALMLRRRRSAANSP